MQEVAARRRAAGAELWVDWRQFADGAAAAAAQFLVERGVIVALGHEAPRDAAAAIDAVSGLPDPVVLDPE